VDVAGQEADRAEGTLARKFLGLFRLSVKRYRRSRIVYSALVLAALPVFGALVFCMVHLIGSGFAFRHPIVMNFPALGIVDDETRYSQVFDAFQYIFKGAFLHFGVIFSAMTFASSVFREESDDQTLHYLFLQPIPRWMIVLGKYAAFLAVTLPVFIAALLAVKLLMILPFGPYGFAQFFGLESLGALAREIAVLLLAFSTYTALFLGLSNIARNPILPLIVYGWETATSFLPETLKQYSIGYYVKSVLPSSGRSFDSPIEMLSEGPSAIQTILVLTLLPVVCVAITCWRAQSRECLYSEG